VKEEDRAGFYVPFCIMVSDDTHDRTMALLEKFNYFGLGKDRVDIVKQENVPALMDNQAKIAVDVEKFKIITKPHGHGDVHNLLFDSGVAKKWKDMGKKWMVFIQDTNALALKAIPSILGVSAKNDWQMNTVCVPRMPGEKMGAICRLIDESDSSKEIVINVEYNQLDSLLKEKWNPAGDIKNDIGYSHFPGNTNTLVFKIPEYYENLTKTGGVIPEFVNPKYANAEKTVFKSATRLECMMQDYPKLLSSTGEVGFTMYDAWYCFSPAKNNINDAAACVKQGIPSYGAAEAEYNFYNWTNKVLAIAGVTIEQQTVKEDFNGMQFAFGPKILMDPRFGITFKEI
jgi:UDP-sugar pyrophosphorylase